MESYRSTVTTAQLCSTPEQFYDQVHTVSGLVKSCRKSPKFAFIVLTDGKSPYHLQVIVDRKANEELFLSLEGKCDTGSSVTVRGLLVKPPTGKEIVEMQAHQVIQHGGIGDPSLYPIAKTKLGIDHLRTIPHLRQRSDTYACITRIQSTMMYAIEEYFNMKGFIKVQPTEITDNECESGANPFTVSTMMTSGKMEDVKPRQDDPTKVDFSNDFFKKQCYLTVSSQLHLEAACMSMCSDVWCPTIAFRGEPSTGPRHLASFEMIEKEEWCSTLNDNMTGTEELIKHCYKRILEKNRLDLEFIEKTYSEKKDVIATLEKYVNNAFIISTHEECVRKMLKDVENGTVKFEELPTYDGDLAKEHERYITEVLYSGLPVFVRYFPKKVKAFYMPVIDEGADIEHVDGYDLIFPVVGEVVGGSQRETDYDKLKLRMIENDISTDKLSFYLDLRKYGTAPHGGMGLGQGRLMLTCLYGSGTEDGKLPFNIKDTIPFPRSYQQCMF
jgi:asparaginyl-tRNA synthetase